MSWSRRAAAAAAAARSRLTCWTPCCCWCWRASCSSSCRWCARGVSCVRVCCGGGFVFVECVCVCVCVCVNVCAYVLYVCPSWNSARSPCSTPLRLAPSRTPPPPAQVRQRGGLRAALERRHQQQQAARAGGAAARPRPDFDRVVAALQKLPTEVVATRAELDAESIPELKRRLAAAGADCRGAVEKAELVAALLAAGGGSSGEGCAICAEEYVPSDVVRVLPCRHRMHLECIDRWLLKSTEHSAPKGCPLCNDERWLGE
ncbi:MAG: hypothetical protein J3K34DRAFT_371568 [Monoraphidium minutum]|nr:MAG: hypothetical protein J3K34DRAFT_371568 [Monoraphidium minutum]